MGHFGVQKEKEKGSKKYYLVIWLKVVQRRCFLKKLMSYMRDHCSVVNHMKVNILDHF